MSNQRKKSSPNQEGLEQQRLFAGKDGFQYRIIHFLQGFSRYAWDLIAIVLIASALILLFGFTGITQGLLIPPLVAFFTRWLGLGRFILIVVMLAVGVQIFSWRKRPPVKISLGRILAFESSLFLLLAAFSMISRGSIAEAEAGGDLGGIIGWGIAEIFRAAVGPTFGFILIAILFTLSVAGAFSLFKVVEKYVQQETGQTIPADDLIVTSYQPDQQPVMAEPEEEEQQQAPKPQKQVWLPPEFRKTFDAPEMEDEKPSTPLKRSIDLPPLDLLNKGELFKPDKRAINLTAGLIEKTLDEFGIPAKVVGFRSGPSVTQFAVEPGYINKADDDRQKIRVSQISSLKRDLALALSAERLRIETPVPGKTYVGIEIPNPNSVPVHLRPLIESETFHRFNSSLSLTLGRDVSGRPVVADLATMPHLLIAGTTGSGKSVCITALTSCLVMNNTPEDLKLAMIDPKRVELMRFNGIPHLLGKVETDIERILAVLRWATTEMDFRYKLLEKARARNIDSYNKKMSRQKKKTLPKIVVIIDELADLMMSAPDQTEHAVVRLAQKARAIGIHMILATQRPSTDVVTGLIKANFPTRISFNVSSSIDSRVILDTGGAETLLGKGDMLFLHPELGMPLRAQGVLVSDKELNRVIRWWQQKKQESESPVLPHEEEQEAPPWEDKVGEDEDDQDDVLIQEAIELIKTEGHASASYFQRQLRVGYPRAARLVDQLEEMGIIGPSQGGGREREILIDLDDENSD